MGGGTRCRDYSQQPAIAEHKLWNLLKRTIQNSCYQLNSTRGISWKSWLVSTKSDGSLILSQHSGEVGNSQSWGPGLHRLVFLKLHTIPFLVFPSRVYIYPKGKYYAGFNSAVSFPPSVDSGPADNSHGPWESHSFSGSLSFSSCHQKNIVRLLGGFTASHTKWSMNESHCC